MPFIPGLYGDPTDDAEPVEALGWTNDQLAAFEPPAYLDSARALAETLRRAFAPWDDTAGGGGE